MTTFQTVAVTVAVVLLAALVLAVRVIKQYETGVVFRLGRVQSPRDPA
jgi:regulator of protease activity HflC (stomatin/prohibitin superfamily)